MHVTKPSYALACDEVCVEYVKISSKNFNEDGDNKNQNQRQYIKEFRVNDGTLLFRGCDDCDH